MKKAKLEPKIKENLIELKESVEERWCKSLLCEMIMIKPCII